MLHQSTYLQIYVDMMKVKIDVGRHPLVDVDLPRCPFGCSPT
jgi:hypothetical protein